MIDGIALGIIGGSGLYRNPGLINSELIDISTPFGPPSSSIIIGELEGKKVAFLSRHGMNHSIAPSEINYRANIYAFKLLGIRRVLSISACGSLREDFAPGDFVLPTQLVDLTRKRKHTFFEDCLVVHVGVADPFCEDLTQQVAKAATSAGGKVHMEGTLVTIEGPRFSTTGESELFRSWGMSIIGMTACPEAFLAREAEMCYVTLAHVTDYDVWHASEESVSVDMVIRTLQANTSLAQKSILHLLGLDVESSHCQCGNSLKEAFITRLDKVPAPVIEKLRPIIGKYLVQ